MTHAAVLASFPELDGTQACRDADAELFFPHPSDEAGIRAAKAVCDRCPLQRPCLAWALQRGDDGVWGGLSPAERASLQRKFRIPHTAYRHQRISTSSTDFDDSEERP